MNHEPWTIDRGPGARTSHFTLHRTINITKTVINFIWFFLRLFLFLCCFQIAHLQTTGRTYECINKYIKVFVSNWWNGVTQNTTISIYLLERCEASVFFFLFFFLSFLRNPRRPISVLQRETLKTKTNTTFFIQSICAAFYCCRRAMDILASIQFHGSG